VYCVRVTACNHSSARKIKKEREDTAKPEECGDTRETGSKIKSYLCCYAGTVGLTRGEKAQTGKCPVTGGKERALKSLKDTSGHEGFKE